MNRELKCQASTHRPPDRANVLWVHVWAMRQIIKCRFHLADRPIRRQSAFELAGLQRVDRDLSLIEVQRERYVRVRREFRGLLLYPLIQTPPFMNHNDRWMATGFTRQREKAGVVPFSHRCVTIRVVGVPGSGAGNAPFFEGDLMRASATRLWPALEGGWSGLEDRQDLLGHKSSRMTTHYSAAELGNLLSAAKLATKSRESPARTVLHVVGG
jgi:hypothetical protein